MIFKTYSYVNHDSKRFFSKDVFVYDDTYPVIRNKTKKEFRVEKIGLHYSNLHHFNQNKYVIKTVWNGLVVKTV